MITDAAKRMSDAVNLATVFHSYDELRTGWMAFALADGSTDHVIYPSKKQAVAHQSDEFRYAYLYLGKCLGGMPVKDAQLWLDIHRDIYDNGGRLIDPADVIMPVARPAWLN